MTYKKACEAACAIRPHISKNTDHTIPQALSAKRDDPAIGTRCLLVPGNRRGSFKSTSSVVLKTVSPLDRQVCWLRALFERDFRFFRIRLVGEFHRLRFPAVTLDRRLADFPNFVICSRQTTFFSGMCDWHINRKIPSMFSMTCRSLFGMAFL
jgi:hypothetical protein